MSGFAEAEDINNAIDFEPSFASAYLEEFAFELDELKNDCVNFLKSSNLKTLINKN